jgi:hypothetical protein
VACSAGDRIGRLAIAYLGEVFGVEVSGHSDHHAGLVFDRVRVGGEVVAPGLGVSGVAELAFHAEVSLILMHEFDDLVSGDVFGESLDVGGIGTWAPGRPGGLRGWWDGGSFLRQHERSR